ncbi:hypothetical protein, partial [Ectopseudomonas mendocina]|uniref:hypothetical protein n=1 Tax=Ectopseudomonas mendocina TaxID=300 RepID=UPI003132D7DF
RFPTLYPAGLENVTGHMYQNKPLLKTESVAAVEAESNEPFQLQLGLQNISVKNIGFDYKNDVSVMSAKLAWGNYLVKLNQLTLPNWMFGSTI